MKRAPVKPIQLTPEQVREIETAVFAVVEQKLDSRFYLLDVAFEKEAGYWYLRVYTEAKEGAISISDCEQISRELDPVVEPLPILADLVYSLEISSPGLFRPLKRQREFDFFAGRVVRIETPAPVLKGKKKAVQPVPAKSAAEGQEGLLQSYDASRNVVVLKSAQNQEIFEVALDESKVVCLNPVIRLPEGDELPE